MYRVHRRIAWLSGALVAALAVVAVPALATQTVKIDSKVTMSSQAPAFHGKVKSDNHACETQRKVKLFRQKSGPDKLLGTDKTNHLGRWKIVVDPLKSGAYYAKVVRRSEGTAGTIFVCRADRSKVIAVD
ncbi:MAG TPA: hypothetical protein VKG89_01725 [Solirubrobacterales bacterium]|nr:hypothetical protein [Solirubrobacterales bacterium]